MTMLATKITVEEFRFSIIPNKTSSRKIDDLFLLLNMFPFTSHPFPLLRTQLIELFKVKSYKEKDNNNKTLFHKFMLTTKKRESHL
jgi:hypothetical protein